MIFVKHTNCSSGKIFRLCCLFILLLIFNDSSISASDFNKKIDSLTNCFKAEKSDSAKILLLNEIASAYFKTLPDTSRILLQKALNMSEQINFQTGLALTYNNLAILARYCGNYQSAIDLISMSLHIYELKKNEKGIANCLDNLGVIYMEQGFYSKALNLFMHSVELHEKTADKIGIAYTCGNIGIVHKLQGDYNQAFKYFSKSLRLNENTGDKKGIAKAYNLLGSIYKIQTLYDEAILCYRKSYQICKRGEDKFGMAFSMEYIAEVFQARGKYNLAINYNLQSMKLRENYANSIGVVQNLYNIGYLYYLMKQYDLSESYILKSLVIAKKINLLSHIQSSYNVLSELYYQKRDYKKSSEYYKISKQLADTINNMQNAKKITQLVMNIEFDKKQQSHEQKERRKEIQRLQDKNRQITVRNILFAGFLFVLIFIFILYRFYRVKLKNNDLLQFKNVEIQKMNDEILVQSSLLEKTNSELEKLSIVARETDNAILIADIQGIIEWVNGGFTKLYGYTYEEFINEYGANILKASSHPEIHDAIFECVCNKKTVFYTNQSKTKSGKKIWSQTTLTPILNDSGVVVKMIAIDSDITKMKLAENEILVQKEELHAQSEQVVKINIELERKNVQITDSIEYAKHIQDGILLTDNELRNIFPESFTLFKPRDIVSGDLFWVVKQDGKTYVSVIDCTGHGVSGAFMGMLGYAFLTEIINKAEFVNASDILSALRDKIISTLGKNYQKGSLPYGMDMALCIINDSDMSIQFSGANCPIYIVKKCTNFSECMREVTVDMHKITHSTDLKRAGQKYHLIEIKASKLPIGLSRKEEDKFVNIELKMEKGDLIFLFTDGYPDQFGGPEGWKFLTSGLKSLILQIFDKPMYEQKFIFEETIENWRLSHKKMYDQTDDITILGIRF